MTEVAEKTPFQDMTKKELVAMVSNPRALQELMDQQQARQAGQPCTHKKKKRTKSKVVCVPGYGHIFPEKLRECHELSLALGRYVHDTPEALAEAREELK